MEVDTAVELTGEEETGDTSTATSHWDPLLLQLPECSPVSLRGHVAEELFSLWLSLPDTARMVRSLIGDMKAGNPINVLGMATMNLSAGGASGSMFPAGSVPPLSPRGSSASPRSSKHKGSPFSRSPLKVVAEPVREVIPQFYFRNGRPPAKELTEQFISEINHFFNYHPDGLRINEFKLITREVFKLPSFLSSAIFAKIDTDCTGRVTRDIFAKHWVDSNFLTMDAATRLFNILKHPNCKYLVPADFRPILLELLATHPGLEFLQNSPEFQERYGTQKRFILCEG